ncbi:MAG TPA: histidine phosphatase family protein [Bacteroidales bacterium]|nr:histidine phosphatase family protein [Bacteroidales bacterium]HSA44132.1 histidine phosphatase family protein [Bacteroidales bacterium]
MKTLYLVRHAKSDWNQPGQKDIDRPLLPKGVKRTDKVIQYLLKKQVMPDLILSSPAVRALLTARQIASGIGYPEKNIQIEKNIYASSEDMLLDLIYAADDRVESIMMVGHNPEMTNLANLFLPSPIEWLPTTGVASLLFETDKWHEIAAAKTRTNFYIYPKALE